MNYWKTMVIEHYEHIDYQQQQKTNHKLFPNSNNIYNNNYLNDGRMGSSSSTLLSSSSASTLSNTSSNHQYHFHHQQQQLRQQEQITSGDTLVQVDVDSLSSPLSIKSINQIKLPNGQATTIVQDPYYSTNYYQQQHHHPNEQQEAQQAKPNSHSNNNSLRSILKNVKAHNGHVTPSDQNSKLTNTSANKGISDRSQPKFGILKKTSNNSNGESSTCSNTNSISATETILQAQCNGSAIGSHQDPSKTASAATTATTARKNPFQYFRKDNKKNVSPTSSIDNKNNNDNNNKPLVRFQMDPSLSPSSSLPSSASTTGSIAHTTTNNNNNQNLTTIPDINKIDHHLPEQQLPNIGASGDSTIFPKTNTVNQSAIASSEIVPLQLSVNYLQVPSSSSSQTLPQTTTAATSSSSLSLSSVMAQTTASKSIHNNNPQQPSSTTTPALQPSKPKASGWNRFMLPSKSINNNGGQSSLTTFPSNQRPTTISNNSARPSIASTNQASYYTTAGRVSDLRKILNPEVEKEDSFKKFTEAIENCDCFEFNLNNAAKLITIVVLLATFILVVKALKGDR